MNEVSRYVAFTPDNWDCYSIELARIILAACSEVDVVAKQICGGVKNGQGANNIENYRQILRPTFGNIEKFQVVVRRHALELVPWENWAKDQTPNWWSDHNSVKHERHVHFGKANLQNAINCVAGLYVMVLYLYLDAAESGHLRPPPFLFAPGDDFAAGYVADYDMPTPVYRLR